MNALNPPSRLILASQSRTRKTLLDNAGLSVSVCAAPIDERAIEAEALTRGATPEGLAKILAAKKALAVSAGDPDALVIGCDQTLAFENRILHKPATRKEAAARLMDMAGKAHHLHSGVALARGGELVWSTVETATLKFSRFTRKELDAVLDREGDSVLQSVGGYRLEGPSVRLFEAIEGDYFTILGLPLLALLAALRTHAPAFMDRDAP